MAIQAHSENSVPIYLARIIWAEEKDNTLRIWRRASPAAAALSIRGDRASR
jgi:hypothetical protein